MATVDKIRNQLIDKIRSIKNRALLEALDNLVTSNSLDSDTQKLTLHQREMLEMSEDDLNKGRFISQAAMDKRNLEWLNGK